MKLPESNAVSNFKGLPVFIWVEIGLHQQSIDHPERQAECKDSLCWRKYKGFWKFWLLGCGLIGWWNGWILVSLPHCFLTITYTNIIHHIIYPWKNLQGTKTRKMKRAYYSTETYALYSSFRFSNTLKTTKYMYFSTYTHTSTRTMYLIKMWQIQIKFIDLCKNK